MVRTYLRDRRVTILTIVAILFVLFAISIALTYLGGGHGLVRL